MNPINRVPYLRTSRRYPEDLHQLSVEVNKSYIDIANAVNNRTIGFFSTNIPSVTGESWFFAGATKQESLREFYQFTSSGNFPHNLDYANIFAFSRIYGTFTDGTYWYPLPYVDSSEMGYEVSVYVDDTKIYITTGTSASIVSGIIVLEYITNV